MSTRAWTREYLVGQHVEVIDVRGDREWHAAIVVRKYPSHRGTETVYVAIPGRSHDQAVSRKGDIRPTGDAL